MDPSEKQCKRLPLHKLEAVATDLLLKPTHYELPRSTPPTEFHYFPKLPTEVRLMIWNMAVRPRDSTRGIEYFSVFRKKLNRVTPLIKCMAQSPTPAMLWPKWRPFGPWQEFVTNFEYRIAAPRVRSEDSESNAPKYSWFNGNPSLYTWDIGLRSACWESRHVITRATESKPSTYREWAMTVYHNESLLSIRDRTQCVFCFDFEREDLQSSLKMNWGIFFQQLPTVPWAIAFEFEPSWLEDMPEERKPWNVHLEATPRGVFARCFDAWCQKQLPAELNILLIDRTVWRRESVASIFTKDKHRVFFHDLHNTYAEVTRRDVWGKGEARVKKKEAWKSSAFCLVDRMEKRRVDVGGRRSPHLGVLAKIPQEKVRHDGSLEVVDRYLEACAKRQREGA